MKSVKLDIARTPHSLNKVLRLNWRVRNEYQHMIDSLIHAMWLKEGRPIFLNPVKVRYVLYFPVDRSRDYDNYLGGAKYFTDALKRTFFLRDDQKFLKKVDVDFAVGPEKTTILIEEVE